MVFYHHNKQQAVSLLFFFGGHSMDNEAFYCRSVFQSGEDIPSAARFNEIWIDLIRQLEKANELTDSIPAP